MRKYKFPKTYNTMTLENATNIVCLDEVKHNKHDKRQILISLLSGQRSAQKGQSLFF